MAAERPPRLINAIAYNADPADINSIPDAAPPQNEGRLSVELGYDPIMKEPVTSGGLPPLMNDINGALNLITKFSIFYQAGGKFVWTSSEPKYLVGSEILGSDALIYICVQENGSDSTIQDPTLDTPQTYWAKGSNIVATSSEVSTGTETRKNVTPFTLQEKIDDSLGILIGGTPGKFIGYDSLGDASELIGFFDAKLQSGEKQSVSINSTIATSKRETIVVNSASSNITLTFDTLTAGEDGSHFLIRNNSDYKCIIKPGSAGLKIWKSGLGYGIETNTNGWILLRYDHDNSILIPLDIGGRWYCEELMFSIPCRELYMGSSTSLVDSTPDEKVYNNQFQGVSITAGIKISIVKTYQYYVAATGGQGLSSQDSTSWDIFGSKAIDFVFGGKFTLNTLGSFRYLFDHFEDGSNRWSLYISSSNTIVCTMASGGAVQFTLTSTTVVTAGVEYDIRVVGKQGDLGLYINGVQEAFASSASWNVDTFTGNMYMVRDGGGTNLFIGYFKDLLLAKQNIFDAAPVVGLTDTITIPIQLDLTLEV